MSAILLCTAVFGYSQDKMPYFEGFENGNTADANGRTWKLNPGPSGNKTANKWYIGTTSATVEPYMGNGVAYISNDGGTNVHYDDTKAVTAVIYKEFTLTQSAYYDLSFSFKAGGDDVLGGDGLQVYVVTQKMNTDNAESNSKLPFMQSGKQIDFDGKTVLALQYDWKTVTTTFQNTLPNVKLVFVWQNNARADKANLSVLIDNIQLGLTESCGGRPTEVKVSTAGTTSTVTWKGGAEKYEVMYKARGEAKADTIKEITNGLSCRINNMKEGVYDFYVRGISGTDTTIWSVNQDVIIFDQTAHCINFIDLNAPGTKCETGMYNNIKSDNPADVHYHDWETVTDADGDGKIDSDHGRYSDKSQHTIHFIGETDAQTGGRLKTVPDGSIASVRLGNWDTGSHAEAITYDIPLDKGSKKLLILKYAVVLNDPMTGHDPKYENPRFKLELLDEGDNVFDPDCGTADFVVGTDITASDDWVEVIDTVKNVIRYKDWTTIGFNLTEYAKNRDRKLKVRLTTADCALGAHYGYAYFTLDCAEAEITGFSCGDNVAHEVSAPLGFNYEWIRESDGKVMGNDQTLTGLQPNDVNTYICTVSNIENPNCNFDLEVSMLPRNPKAKFATIWQPENCTDNYMLLQNISEVVTINGTTGDKCETFYWYVNDAAIPASEQEEDGSLKYMFPKEGGTFNIKLTAGLADDACQDVLDTTITIAPLEEKFSTIEKTICLGDSVKFEQKYYKPTKDTTYTASITRGYSGCDSTTYLKITVRQIASKDSVEICYGDTFKLKDFNGNIQRYTRSEVITMPYPIEGSPCDSLHTVYLTVKPGVDASVGEMPMICADDKNFSVPIDIHDGSFVSYSVVFDDKAKAEKFTDMENITAENVSAIEVTIPDSVRPGLYNAVIKLDSDVEDTECPPFEMNMQFEVRYPASIIQQKFNDVIAVPKKEYNGGYDIASYQWYRNASPIPDATGSYIYLGPDNELSEEDEYSVAVVLQGESTAIMSCPFTPEIKDNINEYISLSQTTVQAGASLYIRADNRRRGQARWWNVNGQQVGYSTMMSGGDYLTAPVNPGMYLLELIFDDERNVYKIFVQ